MRIYYFEKGRRLNSKGAKIMMKRKENKEKCFSLSRSGTNHQIEEYYLKKDIDKMIRNIFPFIKTWNNKKEDEAWKHL